jgi:glycosyltransferase involved in cell wall biosynthesis
MLEVYLNHDIFLISSRYEGFGLVTLEAMECGLPVIGFDIPANKELITNGNNGFLVPCYNVLEYAKTMEMIVNNQELIKKTSNQLNKSIEKFSRKTIILQWHKMLNESKR